MLIERINHRLLYLETQVKTLELRIESLEREHGLGPKEIGTPIPIKTDEVETKPIQPTRPWGE